MRAYRQLMSAFFQGIVEYLFLFPLILIIGYFTINQVSLWIWLISLVVLLFIGVLYRSMLPNQKWWVYFFVSLIVGILPVLIFVEEWLLIGLLGVIQFAFVYRGMMYVDQTKRRRLPVSYLWIGGFSIYFVSYFVFRLVDILNPYLPLITVCGIVLVSLTLFISNGDRLRSATLSKKADPAVSREVKGKNRLFLGVTILFIILVTNIHMIQDGFLYVVRSIVQWIFGDSSSPTSEGVVDEPPPSSSLESPGLPDGESSAVAKFFETIIMYSLYVILIVGAIFLVLLIVKKTRDQVIKIFRTLIGFFKQMVTPSTNDEETAGYVDEKENIFNWQEWKKNQQNKAKKMFDYFKREPSFRSLSNHEKVRYVYRQLLLQKMDKINYKTSNTPRETLTALTTASTVDEARVEKLRIAYERMRYGGEDIDEDVIEEIRLLFN